MPDNSSVGLQAALGFPIRRANLAQRGLQHVVSTRLGGRVFASLLYRIDRPLHRWSHGRMTAPGVFIGLPVVMLTTVGARSGQVRTMPVAAIPFEGDLAVLGTNFAQHRTPGWAANLAHDPLAEVTWQDRSVPVRAVRVAADEVDSVWAAAGEVYAGFPKYRERIGTSREVLAFRLVVRD